MNNSDYVNLVNYFNRLFPIELWDNKTEKFLENLYLSLDSYYQDIIPKYRNIITNRIPPIVPNSWWPYDNIKKVAPFSRLFDGDICACAAKKDRIFPNFNCKIDPMNIFNSNDVYNDPYYLTHFHNVCKTYNIDVSVPIETTMIKGYNTNNNTNNFYIDSYTKTGKGYPSYAWIEGLTYPFEYGHPESCNVYSYVKSRGNKFYQTKTEYMDNKLKKIPLPDIKYNEPLYYAEYATSDNLCKKDEDCKEKGYSCQNVYLGDVYGDKSKNINYCMPNFEENYEEVKKVNKTVCEVNEDSYPNSKYYNCKYDDIPCEHVNVWNEIDYDILWTYPLRGSGIWHNLGKTYVTNSKMGFLLTPKEKGGGGFKLKDLLQIGCGTFSLDGNLQQQCDRLTDIIYYGKVDKLALPDETGNKNLVKKYPELKISDENFGYFPAMTIDDLKKYGGYTGGQETNYDSAQEQALKLMEKWYIDGYTGLGWTNKSGIKDLPFGFLYHMSRYFPIGMYYNGDHYDNLVFYTMKQTHGYDSLQLLFEPQMPSNNNWPVYAFEILAAVPLTSHKDSVFNKPRYSHSNKKGLYNTDCSYFFIANPLNDLDNYIKYGYLDDKKVRDLIPFDPEIMTLTSSYVSFNPQI